MHSLWSKASPSHYCRCRPCSGVVSGAGRRVTTGVRPRKPTFADIFTACYTSMFATAAIVDSIRKEDRRSELDRQLKEAREELLDLEKQRSRLDNHAADPDVCSKELSLDQMYVLWESLKRIQQTRPSMNEIRYHLHPSDCSVTQRLMKELYRCPEQEFLEELQKTDYVSLEDALEAEGSDPALPRREAMQEVQLARTSTNLESMVRRMLHRAKFLGDAPAGPRGLPPCPSYEDAWKLLAEGYPQYVIVPPNDRHKQLKARRVLNSSIKGILENPTIHIKEKIGRICFNILASQHPPNMDTLNILIVAFGKAGHESLAAAAAHTFLFKSRFKPTPSTFVALLHHAKNSDRHDEFIRLLNCITGLDAHNGSKQRRVHRTAVESQVAAAAWASDPRTVTQIGNWFYENLPLDRTLIEGIINGLVRFRMVAQAADFFLSCVLAKVTLSAKTVIQIFDKCIAEMDWQAASLLVSGIVQSQGQWIRSIQNMDQSVAIYLVDRLYVLLDMCGLLSTDELPSRTMIENLGMTQKSLSEFLKSLVKIGRSHPDMPLLDSLAAALDQESEVMSSDARHVLQVDDLRAAKSRLLQYESMSRDIDRVRKNTNSLSIKLTKRNLDYSVRIPVMHFAGSHATEQTLRYCREFAEILSNHGASNASLQKLLDASAEFENEAGLTIEKFLLFSRPQNIERDVKNRWLEPLPQTENEAVQEDPTVAAEDVAAEAPPMGRILDRRAYDSAPRQWSEIGLYEIHHQQNASPFAAREHAMG